MVHRRQLEFEALFRSRQSFVDVLHENLARRHGGMVTPETVLFLRYDVEVFEKRGEPPGEDAGTEFVADALFRDSPP